jgi:hypothetical protein
MRVLAVSILALAASSCGSRSRPPDEVSSLEARKSLPVPARVLPAALTPAPEDAGAVVPEKHQEPAFPRLSSLDAFGEGDRMADLTALRLQDRILLAWVTYFDSSALVAPKVAPKSGRSRSSSQSLSPAASKQGASVMVRAFNAAAEPAGPPAAISVKAESVGGVALALAGASRDEIGLAWVGRDAGVGQVFVTRLSPSGEKQSQRMLTHSKAGCSDVTLAPANGGWIAGWIESHDGGADLNVAKVGTNLARVGGEHRVAQIKGEASELHLVVRGDDLVLVWNEARDDAALSGVFAARVSGSDLEVRGDPLRVVPAAPHARGIDVAPFEDGIVVAWTEDAPPGKKEIAGKRAMALVRLDPSLRLVGEPVRPSLAFEPSAIALDCDRACRVVVPGADQEQLVLYGFGYDGAKSADPPARLSAISGASTEDVSPIMVGDWLFFGEDNLHGGGRLRRAKIAWR